MAPALTSTIGVAAGLSRFAGKLSRFAGKIIAIYTLTESAGRQAAVLLQQLVPNISVELSHDKVGNERLQMLARNADLFVVVTQSAKHAATLFIQRYRQSRPLLFPKGRGYRVSWRHWKSSAFPSSRVLKPLLPDDQPRDRIATIWIFLPVWLISTLSLLSLSSPINGASL